jgi:hypothetical protein
MSDLGFAVSSSASPTEIATGVRDAISRNACEPHLGAAAINFRSVSKDGERDPRFVKPLGAGSNHGGVKDRSVAAQIPTAAPTS